MHIARSVLQMQYKQIFHGARIHMFCDKLKGNVFFFVCVKKKLWVKLICNHTKKNRTWTYQSTGKPNDVLIF
jgi:hypothetical protein